MGMCCYRRQAGRQAGGLAGRSTRHAWVLPFELLDKPLGSYTLGWPAACRFVFMVDIFNQNMSGRRVERCAWNTLSTRGYRCQGCQVCAHPATQLLTSPPLPQAPCQMPGARTARLPSWKLFTSKTATLRVGGKQLYTSHLVPIICVARGLTHTRPSLTCAPCCAQAPCHLAGALQGPSLA